MAGRLGVLRVPRPPVDQLLGARAQFLLMRGGRQIKLADMLLDEPLSQADFDELEEFVDCRRRRVLGGGGGGGGTFSRPPVRARIPLRPPPGVECLPPGRKL